MGSEARPSELSSRWETPEAGAADKKEEEENLFATSGRGIQIIKAITQYVSYETNSGLNETKFVFNKRSAES